MPKWVDVLLRQQQPLDARCLQYAAQKRAAPLDCNPRQRCIREAAGLRTAGDEQILRSEREQTEIEG